MKIFTTFILKNKWIISKGTWNISKIGGKI